MKQGHQPKFFTLEQEPDLRKAAEDEVLTPLAHQAQINPNTQLIAINLDEKSCTLWYSRSEKFAVLPGCKTPRARAVLPTKKRLSATCFTSTCPALNERLSEATFVLAKDEHKKMLDKAISDAGVPLRAYYNKKGTTAGSEGTKK